MNYSSLFISLFPPELFSAPSPFLNSFNKSHADFLTSAIPSPDLLLKDNKGNFSSSWNLINWARSSGERSLIVKNKLNLKRIIIFILIYTNLIPIIILLNVFFPNFNKITSNYLRSVFVNIRRWGFELKSGYIDW